jgi:hypothetical protein
LGKSSLPVHRGPSHRGCRWVRPVSRPTVGSGRRHVHGYLLRFWRRHRATTIPTTWLDNNVVGKKRRGISTAIILVLGYCGSILGSNVYLANGAPGDHSPYGVSVAMTILTILAATCFIAYVWAENNEKETGTRNRLLTLSAGRAR